MPHVKLHIPGPVEVSEKTFKAFCSPMIGHRGQGFKDLYAKVQPQLQQLLYTKQLVYLSTSSAWGVMEGAVRNLVQKKVLNCMCGAFSDKWFDVSKKCGKQAEALQIEWGSPVRAEAIDKKLATGEFDALTLIHNETSTGVMSPLVEIAALKKKYPDVIFIVDAVSSLTALPIKFDELGIDVLLAGTQKAFALPPGLAVFVASPAALAKAALAKDRGYYFDFVEFEKNAKDSMTPSTPSIGHVIFLRKVWTRVSPVTKKPTSSRATGRLNTASICFPKKVLNPSRSPVSATARNPAVGLLTWRNCKSSRRIRAS
jgi:aspartate aminotransferase-like enzyme